MGISRLVKEANRFGFKIKKHISSQLKLNHG